MQTGDENLDNNQLEDTVLMNHRILITNVKSIVRQSVRRIYISSLNCKGATSRMVHLAEKKNWQILFELVVRNPC